MSRPAMMWWHVLGVSSHLQTVSPLLLFILLLNTIHKAWSIKCVQCTTLLNKGCEGGYLPAVECKPDEHFCLKYTGKINSGYVIFRGCNKEAIRNMCRVKEIEGQSVHLCYESCNVTACNSGYYSSGAGLVHQRDLTKNALCILILPFLYVFLKEVLFSYRIT